MQTYALPEVFLRSDEGAGQYEPGTRLKYREGLLIDKLADS